jgi:hypothetical protein
MTLLKKHVTKYGTFCDALTAEDIKYFEMTDEEIDERANRLANKALNGIRDEEVIAADARAFRGMELLFGNTEAQKKKKEFEKIFGY